MEGMPPGLRRRVARARVGHFATSDGRRPGLVPVCFVLIGETVYHAIDAKPKSVETRRLRRVRNVRANPNATLLVDHYEEDWRRLWYAVIRGRARVIEGGAEHRRAIAALRRKYAQYRTSIPLEADALVIALDAAQLSHWQASSPGRRRAGRRDSPA
jgi:PPOX class probable F420-dependent enzyme